MLSLAEKIERNFHGSPLESISSKVLRGERLTRADGIKLMMSNDLLAIGQLADYVRKQKVGDRTYFINNAHINPTNICECLCSFCAFGKEEGHPEGYILSLEQVREKVIKARKQNVSEIHIVGGLYSRLSLDYYIELLKTVKEEMPQVHIQAFDAVEIEFMSRTARLSIEETLLKLKDAGLGSLPGGGAEIFNSQVRQKICPNKISGEKWLEVHRIAHNLGLRTNATMLYGHIESPEDRVDHLLKLRELQDETGGFLTFIPLPFHPKNTKFSSLTGTTGYLDLKVLAIARLLLDNFDHIKAFWIMVTPKVAQISLAFGVDDLDGTVMEEKIVHDAGAETPQYQPRKQFIDLIKEAGRIPVERDTLYNVIKEGWEDE
jgi:aminodeoxyfutalosine synthase